MSQEANDTDCLTTSNFWESIKIQKVSPCLNRDKYTEL